jgi:hypothetical protein
MPNMNRGNITDCDQYSTVAVIVSVYSPSSISPSFRLGEQPAVHGERPRRAHAGADAVDPIGRVVPDDGAACVGEQVVQQLGPARAGEHAVREVAVEAGVEANVEVGTGRAAHRDGRRRRQVVRAVEVAEVHRRGADHAVLGHGGRHLEGRLLGDGVRRAGQRQQDSGGDRGNNVLTHTESSSGLLF